MKPPISPSLACLLLFISCYGQEKSQAEKRANVIDSIKTAHQIEKLIALIDKRFGDFKVNYNLKFSEKECQHLSDSLKVKPWTKVDFDGNGLTDMLVIGSWSDPAILSILDKGDNRFELKRITRRSFQDCTFPLVDTINHSPAIEYYFQSYPERGNWDKPKQLEHKTLIYKFGDFIEANLNPNVRRIEKVEYSTTICFGTCPVFKIEINGDKTATLNLEMYNEIGNKEVEGKFITTIDEQHFNEIIDLINYIDFERLNSSYAVSWTDDQTSTLTVTYDGGKTKSITDYGLMGTYGLDRVYQLFFELRENQKWAK